MQELIGLIRQSQKIVILSHTKPDGDAIGSLIGLNLALRSIGKDVTPVLADPVPSFFSFLDQVKIEQSLPPTDQIDLLIALDLSDLARTGFPEEIILLARQKKLIVIDHHSRAELTKLSTTFYNNQTSSSTSELVYELIQEMGIKLSSSQALALLTGIYTDTGGFNYPNTSTKTLEIAAELMRRGARLSTIVAKLSHHKSIARLKLLGVALKRIQLRQQSTLALSLLTYQDIADCQAKGDDLSGIIGELNVLSTVKATLLLTEIEPGIVRGTLRSGNQVQINVATLAKLLGGGGHPRAAGFIVPGKLTQTSQGWIVDSPD